jgi:hypothetical protein
LGTVTEVTAVEEDVLEVGDFDGLVGEVYVDVYVSEHAHVDCGGRRVVVHGREYGFVTGAGGVVAAIIWEDVYRVPARVRVGVIVMVWSRETARSPRSPVGGATDTMTVEVTSQQLMQVGDDLGMIVEA